MNNADLESITKEQIPEHAKHLNKGDVRFLVEKLEEKADVHRYHALLLLQANSKLFPYTYEYWDALEGKLVDSNSYQRSIGAILIAENVRWDKEGKFDKAIGKYLKCCSDEKFITARQAIQALVSIVKATDKYDVAIQQTLAQLSVSKYKENQQSLLKKDVANVMKIIDSKKR